MTEQDSTTEKEHEELSEFSFVPEIECNKISRNGRIQIHVLNFDKLLEHEKFDTPHDKCFQFIFKDTTENNDWTGRDIKIGNVSNNGKFDVIFAIFLHDYTIQFTLRAINHRTREWLSFSSLITAHVPSMLIDTPFNIGDRVLFRPQQSIFGFIGRIEEALADNQYKILYLDRADTQQHEIVGRTRVFRDSTPQQYEIDLFDDTDMKKQMLIQRDDAESISVFESILDAYGFHCFMHCVETVGFRAALIYYESMATFLTKNIFECLFETMPHFELKVKCLVEPHKDGKLTMQNLRQMAMAKYYKSMQDGVEKILPGTIEHAGDGYQCDWCYRSLNRFDFAFQCEANCMERHDLCVHCVYNVIKLGQELESWLTPILCDELDGDCINLIVDYVVGRPVCIH
eukprot:144756_1